MILFDGKYSWPGDRKTLSRPVSWWPGCYRLKIVDISEENPGVIMLKPVLCMFSDTGEGFCIRNGFQNFALTICDEFSIDINKVLWVDISSLSGNEVDVAVLKNETVIAGRALYLVTWRGAMDNELEMIKKYLP